jgi:hypothetical protein
VGKPEGKRPLGLPRRGGWIILRWILDRQDGSIGWIDLAKDRNKWRVLVNAVINLGVSQNAVKFLTSCTIGGLWSIAQQVSYTLHKKFS